MQLRFQTRQLLGFALVVGLMGTLTIWSGYTFMNRIILSEAQLRVVMDLNSAWVAYREELTELRYIVSDAAHGQLLPLGTDPTAEPRRTAAVLATLQKANRLDFLTLVDRHQHIVATSYSLPTGDLYRTDRVIERALAGEPSFGTVLLSADELQQESPQLAAQAYIPLVATERAVYTDRQSEDRGLAMEAAVPLRDASGIVQAVLYGGILLNKEVELVDNIRRAVFGEVTYDNKPVGTVTIFLWDVRVATNVMQADQTRALGTRVSEDVYRRVLDEGKRYVDRAFVVNDWYLSAYDPITDPAGQVIGIVYVGLLEKKYLAYSSSWAGQFLLISLGAMLLSVIIALYLARTFRRPLQQLVGATRELAAGNLSARVHIRRASRETTELAAAFNAMAENLERRSTELSQASERLRWAYQHADEKNRAYLETLGFVTHELKSPLASIVFAIDAIRDRMFGPLTKEQEAALKSAASSADYLQTTIANYLNLSRVEEGQLKLEPQEVDIGIDIVQAVTERLTEMAADKGMLIVNKIGPGFRIACDPGLLTSVFQNLLTNAVIYGREGGKIELKCSSDTDNVNVEIWNEGIGFSPEVHAHLFERFFRAPSGGHHARAGTGVGLFVTRRIIELHGGQIWAESCEGQWARFSFMLPRRQTADRTSIPGESLRSGSAGQ